MSESTPSENQLPVPTANGNSNATNKAIASIVSFRRSERKASIASSETPSSSHGTGTTGTTSLGGVGLFMRRGTARMMIDAISLQAFTKRKLSRRSTYFLSAAASPKTDPAVPTQFGQFAPEQNTYRTEPKPSERFVPSQVQTIITSILESYLADEIYEPKKCAHLVQNLTDVIKSRVKEMNLPRYKIVCSVVIGQKRHQAVRCASRCLWNCSTDNSASGSYENATLFATATVYAFYFD